MGSTQGTAPSLCGIPAQGPQKDFVGFAARTHTPFSEVLLPSGGMRPP